MSVQALAQISNPAFPDHEGFWEEFYAHCTQVSFKREAVVKAAHTTEQALYFILDGVWGNMLHDVSHDRCLDLAGKHEFMADYSSLLLQQPSALEVRSITPSVALRITHDNLMKLYSSEKGQVIRALVAEQLLHYRQQQLLDVYTSTAKARYMALLNKQPDIVLNTPQKYLASYLGIVPESLSRIRKQVLDASKEKS